MRKHPCPMAGVFFVWGVFCGRGWNPSPTGFYASRMEGVGGGVPDAPHRLGIDNRGIYGYNIRRYI